MVGRITHRFFNSNQSITLLITDNSLIMTNNTTSSFVEVYNGDFPSASLIQQLLEAHEIPAFLKNSLMGSIEPFAVTAGGANPVSIDVHPADFNQAMALIQEFEAQS